MEAARQGVKGYILKSAFSLEDLLTRIKQLCEPELAVEEARKGGAKK
jgi:hypothetical protein